MKAYIGVGISVGVLRPVDPGQHRARAHHLGRVRGLGDLLRRGRRAEGFTKGLAANLSGVAWAWVASKVLEQATFNGAVAIAVTVLAFVLCVQAALPLLSFIPGAFVGTAVFFGTSFDLGGTCSRW